MEKNEDTPLKDIPVDDGSKVVLSDAVTAKSTADPDRFIPPLFPPDFNERTEALWKDVEEIKAQRAAEEAKKNEKE